MSEPKQKPGRSKQNYATPADFIVAAKSYLGIDDFAFDFAADVTNYKGARYWTKEDDSLSKMPSEWREKCGGGWGWLNPPFDDIRPWAQRCAQLKSLGGRVAFLVPAAVGSNWFRDYVHKQALVLMLNGRIHFMPDRPTWGYPKDCILCLYSPLIQPGYDVWSWKLPRVRNAAAIVSPGRPWELDESTDPESAA